MSEAAAQSLSTLPARHLLEQASWAADRFSRFNVTEVDRIVQSVAEKAAEKAHHFAELAVAETGYGVAADKAYKNLGCSAGLLEYYRGQSFCGYEIDSERKVVRIARPAGTVLALVPSTNPIATTYFKIMICLMTRNAVVISPHPAARECCAAVVDCLTEAAEAAGAPKGVIQVVREPSIPLVDALMKSDQVSVILATGGPAMVRAAYSSGNPAIGVGPGNVAHYVDASADVKAAAKRIIKGVAFDNNLPCTCESVILADRAIADQLAAAMIRAGAHHVEGKDRERLESFLYPGGKLEPRAIGKSAEWIAREAAIQVRAGTKVLGVEIATIDESEPFSREKMFPVVGFLKVEGLESALRAAGSMIRMGGSGHSAAIHSTNVEAIARWGSTLRVYRVSVNGVASLTSSGYTSGLPPTVTIGTGFFGRSSVAENVGPEHLLHWTSIAWNEDPSEVMGDVESALQHLHRTSAGGNKPVIRCVGGMDDTEALGQRAQMGAVTKALHSPAVHAGDRLSLNALIEQLLEESKTGDTPISLEIEEGTLRLTKTGKRLTDNAPELQVPVSRSRSLDGGLVTEKRINALNQEGVTHIVITSQAVITPMARDQARALSINIERAKS